MSGLFSSFDGFWVSIPFLLVLSLLFHSYPTVGGRVISFVMKSLSEFSSSFSGKTVQTSSMLALSFCLFVLIFFTNFIGMCPYFYCLTSSPSFSLMMSFLIWLSVILFSFFSISDTLVHLAPQGAPFLLVGVLVIIELVSNLIRPITLGVRLMANLTSGHILMALVAGVQSESVSLLGQMVLLLLELMVSFIQSYVFALLVYLYMMES